MVRNYLCLAPETAAVQMEFRGKRVSVNGLKMASNA